MYTTVKLKCVDQTLLPVSLPKLASGGRKSVRVEFTFDSLWNGFGKTAIFYRNKNSVHHEVLTDDACKAPWHMIFDPGVVYVGVYGSSGGVVRTSEVLALTIEQGAITGASAMEPTPDVYQQVLAAYGEAERAIAVERARIDNFVSGDPADNAEVQDIRVGYDGTAYDTAGGAVRGQAERIRAEIDRLIMPVALHPSRIYLNMELYNSGDMYAADGVTVKEYALTPGAKYYFSYLNAGRNYTHFYDVNFNHISTYTALFESYGSIITIPSNVAYVRYTYMDGYNDVIVPEADYRSYGATVGVVSDALLVPFAQTAQALTDVLDVGLTTYANKYTVQNLLNPEAIQEGVYCNHTTGNIEIGTNYFITERIRITQGQTLIFVDTSMNPVQARMVASFDANGKHIGGTENTTSYTQTGSECYIVATIKIGTQSETMIADSGAWRFMAYGEIEQIKPCYLGAVGGKQVASLIGADACRVQSELLAAGASLVLDAFPRYLKTGQSLSFMGAFETFAGLKIGKGFESYRGHWFDITTSNIVLHKYEIADVVVETVAHGLNISDYIGIMIDVIGNDCKLAINTASGTFSHTFDWSCEACGDPFVSPTNLMTNSTFSATSSGFRCPLWAFGDSYFGVTDERVIGQLRNLGYFDGLLINGLAGQGSGGAYTELQKCLTFGTPKYLVWCLGMNDSDETYSKYLAKVVELCDSRNITLILAKIPTVPERSKEDLNAYVVNSGLRYVDFYQAVGANSAGAWYPDYLSGDSVHPSELGAKALAMRMLIDVPEIMQYTR